MGLTIAGSRGRGARRRSGIVIALVALALTTLAAAARPAHAFEIAVQDDRTLLAGTSYSRTRALDQARAIGATALRVNVIYADWVRLGTGPYDSLVDLARSKGFRLQFTLMGTPRYFDARAPRWIGHRYPSPIRFASWVSEVAKHFTGRVRRYSIWNEPNLVYYLEPQRKAPSMYANLFKAGYQTIKRIDPGAQVLWGELFSGNLHNPGGTAPMNFLWAATRNGARADGLAYHPFQYNLAPDRKSKRYVGISSISGIRANLRDLSRRHRLRTPSGRPLPIYFTEFGYQILGSYPVRSEARRASWTVSAFRIAKRAGVRSMLLYHLVRTYARRWDSGVITIGGTPLLTYRALLGARRALVGR
jgi:hypothetical protein